METIASLLRTPSKPAVHANITERGQLLVWIRDQLNVANRKDGRREVTIAEIARRVKGIPTKDLGRALYYLKGQMEEALERGFPVGASFYPTAKRMRQELKAKLRAL